MRIVDMFCYFFLEKKTFTAQDKYFCLGEILGFPWLQMLRLHLFRPQFWNPLKQRMTSVQLHADAQWRWWMLNFLPGLQGGCGVGGWGSSLLSSFLLATQKRWKNKIQTRNQNDLFQHEAFVFSCCFFYFGMAKKGGNKCYLSENWSWVNLN